jgi:hypothetical protein
LQEQVGLRQGTPQVVQQVAQIGVGLGFGRIGPEEESELRTGLRRITPQYELGQQGLQAGGLEGGHRRFVEKETKIAEQIDVQCRGHGSSLLSPMSARLAGQ